MNIVSTTPPTNRHSQTISPLIKAYGMMDKDARAKRTTTEGNESRAEDKVEKPTGRERLAETTRVGSTGSDPLPDADLYATHDGPPLARATSTDDVNAAQSTNHHAKRKVSSLVNDLVGDPPSSTNHPDSTTRPGPTGCRRFADAEFYCDRDVDAGEFADHDATRQTSSLADDLVGDLHVTTRQQQLSSARPGPTGTDLLSDGEFNPSRDGRLLRRELPMNDVDVARASHHDAECQSARVACDLVGDLSSPTELPNSTTRPKSTDADPLPDGEFYPSCDGRLLGRELPMDHVDAAKALHHDAECQFASVAYDLVGDLSFSTEHPNYTTRPKSTGADPLPDVVCYPSLDGFIEDVTSRIGTEASLALASPCSITSMEECNADFQGFLTNYKWGCFFNVVSALGLHLLELGDDFDKDGLTTSATTFLHQPGNIPVSDHTPEA